MMRVENKKIELKTGKFYIIFIIIAIISLATLYIQLWNKSKKTIINFLSIDKPYISISYDKIQTSGFFFIKNKISNLKIVTVIDKKKEKIILNAKSLEIKNLIFTKNASLSFLDKINFKNDEGDLDINILISETNTINFTFGDHIIDKLEFDTEKFSILINKIFNNMYYNFLFKVTNIKTDDNFLNTLIYLNSDKILNTSYEDTKEISSTENNINGTVSVISEFKDKNSFLKKNIKQEFKFENISFNNITNNFGIKINGYFVNNKLLNQIVCNIDFEIINYNSLIKYINNEQLTDLINKDTLSKCVEVLNLLPPNSRNTLYNKYYKLEFNNSNGKFSINNAGLDKILRIFNY